TWAPDSTKILMIPDDGGPTSAYLLDPTGGDGTKVPWTSDLDLDWQRLALPPRPILSLRDGTRPPHGPGPPPSRSRHLSGLVFGHAFLQFQAPCRPFPR